jgi:hypothetical protein
MVHNRYDGLGLWRTSRHIFDGTSSCIPHGSRWKLLCFREADPTHLPFAQRCPDFSGMYRHCAGTDRNHQELYSCTMFATWVFLALTAVALIRLRITKPELPRPFRAWGYPWTPLVFGAAAFAIAAISAGWYARFGHLSDWLSSCSASLFLVAGAGEGI